MSIAQNDFLADFELDISNFATASASTSVLAMAYFRTYYYKFDANYFLHYVSNREGLLSLLYVK